MLYFFLALLSGVLDAFNGAQMKGSKIHPFILTGLGILCATPVYLFWFWITETKIEIPRNMLLMFFLQGTIYLAANVLWIYAQRISKLTVVLPYLAVTPAALLFISPLVDGSKISLTGILGVLTLSVGLYVLNIEKNGAQKDLAAPIKNFVKDRGAQCMLGVALLFAVNASCDRAFSHTVDIAVWLWSFQSFTGLMLILLAFSPIGRSKKLGSFKNKMEKSDIKQVTLFAMLVGIAMITYSISVSHLIPPFLISLRRVGAISCAFVVGPVLFEERHNLREKIAGAITMLIGMTIIVFAN